MIQHLTDWNHKYKNQEYYEYADELQGHMHLIAGNIYSRTTVRHQKAFFVFCRAINEGKSTSEVIYEEQLDHGLEDVIRMYRNVYRKFVLSVVEEIQEVIPLSQDFITYWFFVTRTKETNVASIMDTSKFLEMLETEQVYTNVKKHMDTARKRLQRYRTAGLYDISVDGTPFCEESRVVSWENYYTARRINRSLFHENTPSNLNAYLRTYVRGYVVGKEVQTVMNHFMLDESTQSYRASTPTMNKSDEIDKQLENQLSTHAFLQLWFYVWEID